MAFQLTCIPKYKNWRVMNDPNDKMLLIDIYIQFGLKLLKSEINLGNQLR